MPDISSTQERPAGVPALRTDTLADSILIVLALTGVQRLVGFCRSVLFCRWLDPDQLGTWDMAFGFLLLAAPLVVLSLPGAFGRYVEHYRQQGQLRTLLRRTTAICSATALAAVLLVCWQQARVSQLVFGTPDRGGLVVLLALSLLAVIAFNFLTELATALRNVRLVSVVQLINSLAFAGLGVGLILGWQSAAASVVLAYGGACLISSLVATGWLWRVWRSLPEPDAALPHRTLWSKLMPFAAWVWTINLLVNLFELADRYMVVHYCRTGDPLAVVGQYHSSRVVPLLLVSVATMLGGILTPHLSCDWEAGRRERVSLRLNLFLKLLAFALTAGAVLVLLAAPLLFGVVFKGKFSGGEAVLPWTLTYCIWFALAMVTLNYLWCVEKARLAGLALLAGLGVNVLLNWLLLPRLGLMGVVLATSAGNLVVLILVCGFSTMLGFRMDRGTWLMLAVPPVVCLGPWLAMMVLAVLALQALSSNELLTPKEKSLLNKKWSEYAIRLRTFRTMQHVEQ